MSDEFTDTVPVSPPSEQAPSPAPDTSETINERRHLALGQLAKDENVEAYAQEREDQAAVIDRGEDIPQERQSQWMRRASKALQDAALEAQGVKLNAQGEPETPPPPPPGFVAGDEAMREIENARKTGAAAMRVQQYFGNNTERKEEITQWHRAMDPEGRVVNWVIENESAYAPQIMERLADNPTALQELAEMPEHQRHRWLGALEGHIAAEQNFTRQLQGQQQQLQSQRRTSQAPPPIRPPRGGGANVPQDLHSLASRGESADAYIKARLAQEKRRD